MRDCARRFAEREDRICEAVHRRSVIESSDDAPGSIRALALSSVSHGIASVSDRNIFGKASLNRLSIGAQRGSVHCAERRNLAFRPTVPPNTHVCVFAASNDVRVYPDVRGFDRQRWGPYT